MTSKNILPVFNSDSLLLSPGLVIQREGTKLIPSLPSVFHENHLLLKLELWILHSLAVAATKGRNANLLAR